MGILESTAALLTIVILFSEPLEGFLGYCLHMRESSIIGSLDEAMIMMLLGLLALKAFRGLRVPRQFALWIPFLILFLISWAVNLSSPLLAVNLALSFLKPFILAVAAVNFLTVATLPRIYAIFKWATLFQFPFLAYQIYRLGYVTGTDADGYEGALNDAHGVAALALIPSLWNLGIVYGCVRRKEPIPLGSLGLGLVFFFITILCEAKFLYMGSVLGIIAFLIFSERTRLIPLLPRLALIAVPLGAGIFYFGWGYFDSLGYDKMFEIFQKLEAYYVTFFELPGKIPFPAVGSGPGTYGSAIALKYMPPLADHFFGDIMRAVTVGGTFMTPFSEINGAFGEFGYLGPPLLLAPYIGHLWLCIGGTRRTEDPFVLGALFCSITLLFIVLIGTLFLPSLVQSHLTFPAFVLSSLVLAAPGLTPAKAEAPRVPGPAAATDGPA
jgi:hypothetical protein